MRSFGEIEKELRTKRGYTLEDVAIGIHSNKGTVSRYESGDREPAFHIIRYFCEFYNVSADYLLGLVDDEHGKYGKTVDLTISIPEQPSETIGHRQVQAKTKKENAG